MARILLIDDGTSLREVVTFMLTQDGHEVLSASNGQAGLELLCENPEVVLTDVRMPGMDGIEVAMHLQQLDDPPAIIFCTAYDQYALAALQHEAVAYLLKPVRGEELSAALDRAGRVNRLQLAALREEGARRSRVSSQTHRGLETLALRMERHCENALTVAEYQSKHPLVSWVNYAALPDSPYRETCERICGGKAACLRFTDA